MADVFISYARQERALATPIRDRLSAFGLTTFFDIDGGIDAGDSFPQRIADEILAAKVVVACWTPHALSRDWVRREGAQAQALGLLAPVAVAPLGPRDLKEFVTTSYEDLSDFTGQAQHFGWSQLLAAISRKLSTWIETNANADDSARVRACAERLMDASRLARPPGETRTSTGPRSAGELWGALKDSHDVEELTAFADSFPNEAESFEARKRVNAIKRARVEWANIDNSLDGPVYQRFAKDHPGATESEIAGQRIGQLNAWLAIDAEDPAAVRRFLTSADPFAALAQYANNKLNQLNAAAEAKAREREQVARERELAAQGQAVIERAEQQLRAKRRAFVFGAAASVATVATAGAGGYAYFKITGSSGQGTDAAIAAGIRNVSLITSHPHRAHSLKGWFFPISKAHVVRWPQETIIEVWNQWRKLGEFDVPWLLNHTGPDLGVTGEKLILSVSGKCQILDATSGALVAEPISGAVESGPAGFDAVQFGPEDATYAIMRDEAFRLVDFSGVTQLEIPSPPTLYTRELSEDRRLLVWFDRNGVISAYNLPSGELAWQHQTPPLMDDERIESIQISANNRIIAYRRQKPTNENQPLATAHVVSLDHGELLNVDEANAPAFGATSWRMSRDGRQVLFIGSVGNAVLYDLPAGADARHFNGMNVPTLSPDGAIIAAQNREGKTQLWSTATGELLVNLPGKTRANLGKLQFSDDGSILFEDFSDIRVWRIDRT